MKTLWQKNQEVDIMMEKSIWKVCPICGKVYDKEVNFESCGCPSCYERNRRKANNLKELMSRSGSAQNKQITA